MKKNVLNQLLVMMALLLVSGIIEAQNNILLLEEGKRWNVVFRDVWIPPQPQRFTTHCYKLEGDVTWNGVTYKIMYSTLYENLSNYNYQIALREDAEGKVYSRYSSSSDETLLYDFSLQPNDSIHIHGASEYLILEDVHDTVIGDVTRKKFTFNYSNHNYEKEIWVEGIGSEYGILNPGALAVEGYSSFLLCSYDNEDLVWQNAEFNTCFYTNWDYDVIPESEIYDIELYPNPLENIINIGLADYMNCQLVEIYAIDGRLLHSQSSNFETVDMSSLESGIYIIKVRLADGREYAERVVKE